MKKIVGIFIFLIFFIFIGIYMMVYIDERNIIDNKEEFLKRVDLNNIKYINKYDNNYIVMDLEYLYLFNNKYEEIYKVKIDMIYDNKNNYDVIYRDKTIMYMDNYKNKKGIIFRYYDIYTYELIDELVVGGNL